jgi:hypothetical protein
MILNLNRIVRVQLTDWGRDIDRARHEAIFADTRYKMDYIPHEEDKDGWSKWQLWHLMEVYGKYMGMCEQLPFLLDIEIPEK